MSAVYSLPGMYNFILSIVLHKVTFLSSWKIILATGVYESTVVRVTTCFAFAIMVYGLLFFEQTSQLSVGLGVVLVGMVALFLGVVIKLGIDWRE